MTNPATRLISYIQILEGIGVGTSVFSEIVRTSVMKITTPAIGDETPENEEEARVMLEMYASREWKNEGDYRTCFQNRFRGRFVESLQEEVQSDIRIDTDEFDRFMENHGTQFVEDTTEMALRYGDAIMVHNQQYFSFFVCKMRAEEARTTDL